ncbi:hypothetical protein LSUB1_G007525 [Lachnellula subtilissima]|uniref:Uncharacterized protein n=1 Tax=Lachnellula subtilissima TaxID=602034 RepID=A0A8H8U6W3_9HELO|nr:hypothetical protein LSUB1_G007525 [Lachnellula subtilissima]
MAAMPDLANEEVIKSALIENHGNVNNAVSYLMEFQYSSYPSTPGSFSPSNSDGSISIQRDSDGRAMKALPKRRDQQEETKLELNVIPTIELTQPDAEKADCVSTQIYQPTPLRAAHDLTKDNKSVIASDGDDEFRPEDSASEVSSRSPSVNPANPCPRPKIILNNNRKKTGNVIKHASHIYQAPQSSSQSSQDASYTTNPPGSNPKSRITARQRKDDKKHAQKQAAKERKRSKSEGLEPEPSTSNLKHVSPPMEKVLCVGNMIVA